MRVFRNGLMDSDDGYGLIIFCCIGGTKVRCKELEMLYFSFLLLEHLLLESNSGVNFSLNSVFACF